MSSPQEGGERLVAYLGDELAALALEGFKEFVKRDDLPNLDAIASAHAEGKSYNCAGPVLIGLSEAWKAAPSLDGFDPGLLKAALAFELIHPTFDHQGKNTSFLDWKDAVFAEQPELARDAYVTVARAGLSRNSLHVSGLWELFTDKQLQPFSADVALDFLQAFPNAEPSALERVLRAALAAPPATLAKIAAIVPAALARTDLGESQRDFWVAAAYLMVPDAYRDALKARVTYAPRVIWALRDLSKGSDGDGQRRRALTVAQLECLIESIGMHFANVDFPRRGWSGDTNDWDGAEWARILIAELSTLPSADSSQALERLIADPRMSSYEDRLRHSLATQKQLFREARYEQPNWQQVVATLDNGPPANVPDLHALVVAQCRTIAENIAHASTDIYRQFWNETASGLDSPKPEESGRDSLLQMLQRELQPRGVIAEAEGNMAKNKRADISVAIPNHKILVELKRDYHAEVWTAAEGQLANYVRDPQATGFGVYGVFWYGDKRPFPIPGSRSHASPASAQDMEAKLRSQLTEEQKAKIEVIVFDVSDGTQVPKTSKRAKLAPPIV